MFTQAMAYDQLNMFISPIGTVYLFVAVPIAKKKQVFQSTKWLQLKKEHLMNFPSGELFKHGQIPTFDTISTGYRSNGAFYTWPIATCILRLIMFKVFTYGCFQK